MDCYVILCVFYFVAFSSECTCSILSSIMECFWLEKVWSKQGGKAVENW